jgi:hypothetical protein
MRILLDENVPIELIRVLRQAGFHTDSVNHIGWKGIQNGELVQRASQSYNLLLTRDKDFVNKAATKHLTRHLESSFSRFRSSKGPLTPHYSQPSGLPMRLRSWAGLCVWGADCVLAAG